MMLSYSQFAFYVVMSGNLGIHFFSESVHFWITVWLSNKLADVFKCSPEILVAQPA